MFIAIFDTLCVAERRHIPLSHDLVYLSQLVFNRGVQILGVLWTQRLLLLRLRNLICKALGAIHLAAWSLRLWSHLGHLKLLLLQ